MGNRHSIGHKRHQKVIQGSVNVPTSCTLDKTSLVVTASNGTKYWKTRTIEVRDNETGDVLNTETELTIRNQELQNWLSSYGVNLYTPPLTEEQEKKKKAFNKPVVAIEQLFHALPTLQNCQGIESMIQLCKYVEEEKEKNQKKALSLLEKGLITFDCCWDLFSIGKQVAVELPALKGTLIGTKIQSIIYARGVVPYWMMSGKVIKSDGKEFFESTVHFSIGYFTSPTPLEHLKVRPLDNAVRARLEERGTKFREIALSHRYMHYEGFFEKTTGFGASKFKADGRVMVDVTTHNRLHPNDSSFLNPNGGAHNNWNNNGYGTTQCEYTLNTTLPDEQLFCTWPTLAGFSFQRKRWGELQVDGLSHIQFDEGAFEKLVMKPKTKNLIRGMVRSSGPSEACFRDFISAKGGGCVFLLHGPPGTGKTLTAEAVSEFLHTPLYSVSMGELGVTTQALETNLQQILEVAAIWGASILLDEADIFLEKRSANDIVRNAMVGIFLRLLEYHQGVLFLTTNRLKSFDPAFQSRVSIAIKYKRLDFQSRRKIWSNFLSTNGLRPEPSELDSLAQFKLNGRQIRNTLRLASVIATEEGVELELRHIQEMLVMSKKWFRDFNRRGQGTSTEDDNSFNSNANEKRKPQNVDIYDSEGEDDEN